MSVQIHTGCRARGLHLGEKNILVKKKHKVIVSGNLIQFLSACWVSLISMAVPSGEKTTLTQTRLFLVMCHPVKLW